MADTDEMSKSAKRRAAKKARDSAAAEALAEAEAAAAAAAAAAAVGAKPKGKAKAAAAASAPGGAEPKAKGKAKAKAEPTAEPEAEPKAKAKGKAKAEPAASAKAAAAPKADAASAKAKGKAQPKSQPAPAPAPEEAPAPKSKGKAKKKNVEETAAPAPQVQEEGLLNFQIDDGSGPAWEVSTGANKRTSKRKDNNDEPQPQTKTNGASAGGKKKNSQAAEPAAQPQQQKPQKTTSDPAPKTALAHAAAEVERILNMKAPPKEVEPKETAEPEGPQATATVHVPEKRVGIVIGPKGARIKMLQEKTGVTRIDTSGEVFTISGPVDAVPQCEAAIKEIVEKGYCALMYENFGESFINVHPSMFPDIIGKQGTVLRKIKEELNVEVSIPDVPKDSAPGKKFKVSLAGSVEDVEKAKTAISDIVMYSHSELTHPGQVHEELDIEPWAYRFIIGRAGSEMKHIQGNWSVRVNIPREHSANEKVLIVGEKDNVERAKAYVEKLVWNAENQAKGREKEDTEAAADHLGEEAGGEEAWMKPYIYKR